MQKVTPSGLKDRFDRRRVLSTNKKTYDPVPEDWVDRIARVLFPDESRREMVRSAFYYVSSTDPSKVTQILIDAAHVQESPDFYVKNTGDLPSLPPANTNRWVVSRKASVVENILFGESTIEGILQSYATLSSEELLGWIAKYLENSRDGLSVVNRAAVNARKQVTQDAPSVAK